MKKDPYRQRRYLKDMAVAASQDFAEGISCTSFLVPGPLADSQQRQYLALGTLEQLEGLLKGLKEDLEAGLELAATDDYTSSYRDTAPNDGENA